MPNLEILTFLFVLATLVVGILSLRLAWFQCFQKTKIEVMDTPTLFINTHGFLRSGLFLQNMGAKNCVISDFSATLKIGDEKSVSHRTEDAESKHESISTLIDAGTSIEKELKFFFKGVGQNDWIQNVIDSKEIEFGLDVLLSNDKTWRRVGSFKLRVGEKAIRSMTLCIQQREKGMNSHFELLCSL